MSNYINNLIEKGLIIAYNNNSTWPYYLIKDGYNDDIYWLCQYTDLMKIDFSKSYFPKQYHKNVFTKDGSYVNISKEYFFKLKINSFENCDIINKGLNLGILRIYDFKGKTGLGLQIKDCKYGNWFGIKIKNIKSLEQIKNYIPIKYNLSYNITKKIQREILEIKPGLEKYIDKRSLDDEE